MPIIKPEGLLGGDRIAELSDEARLYWPFLYAASNGYGRFEIDYMSILQSAFGSFLGKPSEEFIHRLLAEYRDRHLLFLYETEDGQVWGAWDSLSVRRYFTWPAFTRRLIAAARILRPIWRSGKKQSRTAAAIAASLRRAAWVAAAGGLIAKEVRAAVFEQDGRRCRKCGATERLSLDHKRPISKGGTNDRANLQTLCVPCNSAKCDRIGEGVSYASN